MTPLLPAAMFALLPISSASLAVSAHPGSLDPSPSANRGGEDVRACLIENVQIASPEREASRPGMSVLIEHGAIIRIESAGVLKAKPGVVVIDGKGRYLSPGFCDMHVHLPGVNSDLPASFREEALSLMLEGGVTTARVARGAYELLETKRAIAEGRLRGPRLLVAAPALRRDSFPTLEEARSQFSIWRAQGFDAIKFLSGPEDADYPAYVEAARLAGLPWYGHLPPTGLGACGYPGQVSVEHASALVRAFNADPFEFQNDVDSLAALNVFVCPDIDFYYVHSNVPSTEELLARDGVGSLPHGLVQSWAENRRLPDPRRQKNADLIATFSKTVPMLRTAGLRLLLSASDGPYIVPGKSLAVEAAHLARMGFTPRELLAMATLNAASCLAESDRYGTVEVGRVADLVLLDEDPLLSADALGKVSAVLQAGRLAFTRD